jgi:hypothetical protein
MTDPTRWRDDPGASDEARSLLRHARRTPELPPTDATALGQALEELARPPLTPPMNSPWPAAWLLKAAGVVGLTTAVLVAAANYAPSQQTARAPHASPAPAVSPAIATPPAPTVATAPVVPPVLAPAPSPVDPLPRVEPTARPLRAMPRTHAPLAPSAPTPAAPPSPVPTANTGASAGGTVSAPTAPVDTLALEVRTLEDARRLLDASPAEALARLESHAAAHPGGVLVEERELLAVEALGRMGRASAQQARGRSFLARFPRSAHAPRVRRLLSSEHDSEMAP